MIKGVQIRNFTVFKDINIEFCKGINVLIGENGTGKTHLLKILYGNSYSAKYYSGNNIYNNNPNGNLVLGHFLASGYEHDSKIYKSYEQENNTVEATIFFDDNQSYGLSDQHKLPNEITNEIVFIPAKEMLSHSKGLLSMAQKYSKDMPFDKTLLDIIEKAQSWKMDVIPTVAKKIIPMIERVIDGKVIIKWDNSFWIQKNNGNEIPFSMEAEGFRKFGLLWQLLMNESIKKGTILFWDEPEANLSPKLIPALVDILLELSRNGVQVFLTTHSYILSKYFEISCNSSDDLMFYSLFKAQDGEGVKYHKSEKYKELHNNSIEEGSIMLYNAIIDKTTEGINDE